MNTYDIFCIQIVPEYPINMLGVVRFTTLFAVNRHTYTDHSGVQLYLSYIGVSEQGEVVRLAQIPNTADWLRQCSNNHTGGKVPSIQRRLSRHSLFSHIG